MHVGWEVPTICLVKEGKYGLTPSFQNTRLLLQPCARSMQRQLATDQYALIFLISYDESNGPICRLQMQIMMMYVDTAHCNARWVGGADCMSRKGGDIWFDHLISKHQAFAATF